MDLELSYAKLIEEEGLSIETLPKDIQVGIKALKQRVHGVSLVETRGQSVTQTTIDKIAREDKILTKEILDYLKEKEEADAEKAATEAAAKAEADKKAAEEAEKKKKEQEGSAGKTAADTEKETIEKELDALHKTGTAEFTLEQIKSSCPVCYNLIFQSYKNGEENGIETSRFSLIEFEAEKFKLKTK